MNSPTLEFQGLLQNRHFHFYKWDSKAAASASGNTVDNGQAARLAARKIMSASIQAVDPKTAVKSFLRRDGNILTIDGRSYALSDYDKIMVYGVGKAGAFMAQAVTEIVPEVSGGVVIVKDKHVLPGGESADNVMIREAAHPIPNQAGIDSTAVLLESVRDASEGGLNRCLFIAVKSGGGSALMEKLAGDLTLEDLKALNVALQSKPLTINEINAVRKHVSAVKGGQLGRVFSESGADTITLILSDVIGDKLEVIASGPTVPDPTTYQDAWDILEKHHLVGMLTKTAPEVITHLLKGLAGEIPETPTEEIPRIQNVIVGNNRLAAEAAAQKATELGFDAYILEDELTGEVADVSPGIVSIAQNLVAHHEFDRPVCLVLGGETTVALGDAPGLGGRNQDLAVRASINLRDIPNILIAHYGTDGTDGNNDAAGGFGDSELIDAAASVGLDARAYLEKNDTYTLLRQLGKDYHIVLGPTGTNVCDITLILAWPA